MKDKEKKKESIEKAEQNSDVEVSKQGHPFVFEEDKKLLEELIEKNRYIRGIFSS